MPFYDEYNKVIHEYFDLSDRDTRKTLIGLDEADQNQLLAALTSKLYDQIVDKVDDIDFGTLPRSRGDITKIENYANLMECLDILRGIVVEYKEDTYPIDVVSTAVENLKTRKSTFMKAYKLNVEMPIVLYNTIALAIVSSVSFLISGCIEYVKDPGAETFNIALDKVGYNKTAHNLLFENLANFNEACKKGDIDTALEDVIRNNQRIGESAEGEIDFGGPAVVISNNYDPEQPEVYADVPEDAFERDAVNDDTEEIDAEEEDIQEGIVDVAIKGASAAGKVAAATGKVASTINKLPKIPKYAAVVGGVYTAGKALISIAKLIIPLLQNIVYYFYQSKQDISDYFAVQSELVQMNAYRLQYNTDIDAAKRKDIYRKQMRSAERLKKLSNALEVKYGKASKASSDMIKDEKKKYKTADLGTAAPAGNSALF